MVIPQMLLAGLCPALNPLVFSFVANPAWQSGGVLVGSVDLSYTDASRTRHLTLNPPSASAYLCNMAVAAAYRRRGYGMAILRAADALTDMLGYPETYLHLRCAMLFCRGVHDTSRASWRGGDFTLMRAAKSGCSTDWCSNSKVLDSSSACLSPLWQSFAVHDCSRQ